MPRTQLSGLAARIVFADTEVETLVGEDENGEKQTKIVDLALEGQYMISVEFFEPAQPAVVIMAQNFTFPHTVTKADAYQRIHDYGQRIFWARNICATCSVGEIINIKKPERAPVI